jgi:hypothetical protein
MGCEVEGPRTGEDLNRQQANRDLLSTNALRADCPSENNNPIDEPSQKTTADAGVTSINVAGLAPNADTPWYDYIRPASGALTWTMSGALSANTALETFREKQGLSRGQEELRKEFGLSEQPSAERAGGAASEPNNDYRRLFEDAVTAQSPAIVRWALDSISQIRDPDTAVDANKQRLSTGSYRFYCANPLAFARTPDYWPYEAGRSVPGVIGKISGFSAALVCGGVFLVAPFADIVLRIAAASMAGAIMGLMVGVGATWSASWLTHKIVGIAERWSVGLRHPGHGSQALDNLALRLRAQGTPCEIKLALDAKTGGWLVTVSPSISYKGLEIPQSPRTTSDAPNSASTGSAQEGMNSGALTPQSISSRVWSFLSLVGVGSQTWNSLASLGSKVQDTVSAAFAYRAAERDKRERLHLAPTATAEAVRVESGVRALNIPEVIRQDPDKAVHTFPITVLDQSQHPFFKAASLGLIGAGALAGTALTAILLATRAPQASILLSSVQALATFVLGAVEGGLVSTLAFWATTFGCKLFLPESTFEKIKSTLARSINWLFVGSKSPALKELATQLKNSDPPMRLELSVDDDRQLTVKARKIN